MRKKKIEKKFEYVQRPDLPQVRTWFDYRDGKWHRIWFNSKWTIKEEILDKEEDTYLYS